MKISFNFKEIEEQEDKDIDYLPDPIMKPSLTAVHIKDGNPCYVIMDLKTTSWSKYIFSSPELKA